MNYVYAEVESADLNALLNKHRLLEDYKEDIRNFIKVRRWKLMNYFYYFAHNTIILAMHKLGIPFSSGRRV